MGAAKIRVGLVGYGHAGAVFHAPLIRAAARLELAAVATGREERVARDLPGVRRAAGPAELFTDPSIDLVVIATPNETHRALALAALDAGKHVVVDKPLANSAREAEELILRARARGRTLSAFQNRRWDGDFLTVKRLIDEGALGSVEHYESRFDRFRPEIKPGWREKAGAGAGLLYDLGSHLIDQALVLFGMPEAVDAEIVARRPDAEVDDYFLVTLSYGARRAILGASMLAREAGPRFLVRGAAGSFVKRGLDPQEEALKAGRVPEGANWGQDAPELYGTLTTSVGARPLVTSPGAYPEYYARLAASLLDGEALAVPADDARRALVVLEAARLSATEKRIVPLRPEK